MIVSKYGKRVTLQCKSLTIHLNQMIKVSIMKLKSCTTRWDVVRKIHHHLCDVSAKNG